MFIKLFSFFLTFILFIIPFSLFSSERITNSSKSSPLSDSRKPQTVKEVSDKRIKENVERFSAYQKSKDLKLSCDSPSQTNLESQTETGTPRAAPSENSKEVSFCRQNSCSQNQYSLDKRSRLSMSETSENQKQKKRNAVYYREYLRAHDSFKS